MPRYSELGTKNNKYSYKPVKIQTDDSSTLPCEFIIPKRTNIKHYFFKYKTISSSRKMANLKIQN